MTSVVKTIFDQNSNQFAETLQDGADKLGKHAVGERSSMFIYELAYREDFEKEPGKQLTNNQIELVTNVFKDHS